MIKKLQFTMLIAVLAFSFALAQNGKVVEHHKILLQNEAVGNGTVTDNYTPTTFPVVDPTVGDSIIYTQYDYFTNSITRDQIVFYNGKPYFAVMARGPLATATRRAVIFIRVVGTNYVAKPVFDTTTNSGWPHIDVCLTGTQGTGTIGIVGHHVVGSGTPSKLAIWDESSTSFITSQFDGYTDPSLQFAGDNIFLGTSGNRLQYMFYKTTNFGTNFILWDSISRYSPSPLWWTSNGGVEVGMSKSANENYLAYFGTNEGVAGGGNHLYNGIARNQCDNFWMIKSTNKGTSWTGIPIAVDGDTSLLSNTYTAFIDTISYTVSGTTYNVVYNKNVDFKFAPLFENFGQVDLALDNSGNAYAVANGYGLAVKNIVVTRPGTTNVFDTVLVSGGNIFPVIFWSSATNTWKSIGLPLIDTLQDVGTYYPTNSIGQAYPSVSVTPDGKFIFVTWTAPQTTSNKLDTAAGYYWRDMYYNFSTNGGTTWSGPTLLKGEKNRSECFGHASQHLQVVTGANPKWVAHIVYLSDLETTVGPFSSVYTNNPIIYRTVSGPLVGVEDGNVVSSYELSQNYPNPFNPSTAIKFNIGQRNLVTLKVFDVLGREVSTLVNEVKDAGNYEINFNASNLASGMYFYTINAGNFSATKKMMLIK